MKIIKVLLAVMLLGVLLFPGIAAAEEGMVDRFIDKIIGDLIAKGDGEFDHREIAKTKFEELIYALEEGDHKRVDALFSNKAKKETESLPDDILKLIEYFDGEMISYNDWSGPSAKGSQESGKRRIQLFSTFDVETTAGKYRFAMKYVSVDEDDPDNIGIWSVYIIEAKDTNEKYAYRGDKKYIPGIHFDIPHIHAASGD